MSGQRVTFVAILGCLVLGQLCRAALVSFDPLTQNQTIKRNSMPVPLPMFSGEQGLANYQYIEDVYQNTAIAHSGAYISGPSSVFQHVYAYTMPNSTTKYEVRNVSGFTKTMALNATEAGRREGAVAWTKEYVELNGSMLLVKGPDQSDSFKGLNATVNVKVTYDFDFFGRLDHKIPITVFQGTINLRDMANGKAFFYTTGQINRNLAVSSVEKTGDTYKLNFDHVKLPFWMPTKVGADYQFTTTFTSSVKNRGDGSGAEINFLPQSAVVPEYAHGQTSIPEPATMALLLSGGVAILRNTRKNRAHK